MASPQSSQRYFSREEYVAEIATGGTTVVAFTNWLSMHDAHGAAFGAIVAALTGDGITKMEIIASDSSDGSTNVTVVKDSGTVAADAVDDEVYLECTAEEIREVGERDYTADPVVDEATPVELAYVNVRLTLDNGSDVAAVFGKLDRMHHQLDLTPATRIA